PLFFLFARAPLPGIPPSAAVFAASAVVLLSSLAVCLILALAPGKGESGPGARVLALDVLIFFAVLVHDNAAVGNAYHDRVGCLALRAPAAGTEHAKEPPRDEATAAGQAAANAGKAVFEAKCSGCHRFDIRVVGPPLNVAGPEDGGDPEKLQGFIRHPGKVNPD